MRCAVVGCVSDNQSKRNPISKDIKFFSFPKDPLLSKRWLHLTERKDKVNVKRAVVCSKHFCKTDYKVNLKHELLGYTPKSYRGLKDDAIPTQNLPQSQCVSLFGPSTSGARENRKISFEKRVEKKQRAEVINDIMAKDIILFNTQPRMSSTDSEDESEDLPSTPPRKRIKRGHLDSQSKEMIYNVYKNEMLEHPGMVLREIEGRVAAKTGVCFKTVFNVVREFKLNNTFSEPKKIWRKKQIVDSVEDFDKSAIRRKVHEFYFRNELPTANKLLKEVNGDPDLPNFKRTTFWKLLKLLNFKFIKRGMNSMLLDEREIVLWRRDYLRKIREYRNKGRKIYYMDETWINAGQVKSEVCEDASSISSSRKKPSEKGKELIICHIASEEGFVPDALWTLESKKKSGVSRNEINGRSFEQWFSETMPKLEDNCVIVLDTASYHSRKLEKIPTSTSKKTDIQKWLLSKNIKFDDQMLRVELLALVKEHRQQYDKYIIDEMATQQNKTVLRLPPYHGELNPMESIWAEMKRDLADMKIDFNVAMSLISPEKWQRCIENVRENVEPKMWELDDIVEVQIEPILQTLVDSCSSSISELDSE